MEKKKKTNSLEQGKQDYDALMYWIKRIVRENYPTILIFMSLSITIGLAYIYLNTPRNTVTGQAIAINVLTDGAFTVFTILGIALLHSFKRKSQDRWFNEFVFKDLVISLNKTMLNLMVEIKDDDKKLLIRENWDYLSDKSIQEAFYRLADNPDELDPFILSLDPKSAGHIVKMVKIRNIIDNGIKEMSKLSQTIRPIPYEPRMIKSRNLRRIEDIGDYEEYLRDGKKYGTRHIHANGHWRGVKTEVHEKEWRDILREFKSELKQDITFIADKHDVFNTALERSYFKQSFWDKL